jgi:membrane protein
MSDTATSQPPAEARPDPTPQPERAEPRQADPSPTTLSGRDYAAILLRALKETSKDHLTNVAAALAYYGFLAIPSALLVAVGIFTLVATPADVSTLMSHLQGVVPQSAVTLIDQSLTRAVNANSGSVLLIVIGALLAIWTLTGAMTTLMWALNIAYDRDETRGFVKQRLTALAMLVCVGLAVILAFGLLVLGPHLSVWVGQAIGARTATEWVWWIAEWPILLFGLLVCFAGVLYLGPDVDHPRFRFLSFGAIFAVVVWLLASGAFAFYAGNFSSYNKTWGALAAVIIMLTWLWLSSLALLVGAEINAEAERSRELRRGEPAEHDLQLAPRG